MKNQTPGVLRPAARTKRPAKMVPPSEVGRIAVEEAAAEAVVDGA
jgi:hypothetical protein